MAKTATKEDVDAIYQEQLGRAPDQAGYDAYVGKPIDDVESAVTHSDEYLTKTTGVTVKTVDVNGTPIKVYDNLNLAEGDTFTMSHKGGDVFAVPAGTPVSDARNYKYVKTVDGYDYYVNEGGSSGGLSGFIEGATGGVVNLDNLVPNEVKSGLIPITGLSDPFGITQGFWGEEYSAEGKKAAADITGLQESEIQFLQDIGVDAVSLTTALMGHPYVGAGIRSTQSASKTAANQQDTEKLLTDIGINYAIAGALDWLSTPGAPKTPGGAPGSSGYTYDQFNTNPSALPMSGGGTPAFDSFNPNWFLDSSAPVTLTPGAAADAGALAIPGAAPASSAAWGWKEYATVGSLALGAGGLALQGAALLSAPSPEETSKQDYEYQKKLLQMKIDAESKLQAESLSAQAAMQSEALAPLPASPVSPTYKSGSVKKPYGTY